jgi:hypothetical protein
MSAPSSSRRSTCRKKSSGQRRTCGDRRWRSLSRGLYGFSAGYFNTVGSAETAPAAAAATSRNIVVSREDDANHDEEVAQCLSRRFHGRADHDSGRTVAVQLELSDNSSTTAMAACSQHQQEQNRICTAHRPVVVGSIAHRSVGRRLLRLLGWRRDRRLPTITAGRNDE